MSNDNHPPKRQLDIAGVPLTILVDAAEDAAARERARSGRCALESERWPSPCDPGGGGRDLRGWVAAMKPDEPLRDVTRWFLVVGLVACIVAALPLIATLILTGWWAP
jgi:hypothetical protein